MLCDKPEKSPSVPYRLDFQYDYYINKNSQIKAKEILLDSDNESYIPYTDLEALHHSNVYEILQIEREMYDIKTPKFKFDIGRMITRSLIQYEWKRSSFIHCLNIQQCIIYLSPNIQTWHYYIEKINELHYNKIEKCKHNPYYMHVQKYSMKIMLLIPTTNELFAREIPHYVRCFDNKNLLNFPITFEWNQNEYNNNNNTIDTDNNFNDFFSMNLKHWLNWKYKSFNIRYYAEFRCVGIYRIALLRNIKNLMNNNFYIISESYVTLAGHTIWVMKYNLQRFYKKLTYVIILCNQRLFIYYSHFRRLVYKCGNCNVVGIECDCLKDFDFDSDFDFEFDNNYL